MALTSNTHLALLALLLGTQQGDSHRYRTHHPARRFFNPSPAFVSDSMASSTGTFRPSHAYPRGGRLFTSSGGPLVDLFQEVMGDIKKVAGELSDSASTAATPPHEILDTDDAAILTADLPGCKRQDVDAQISEDRGTKMLTITAVRKKPLLANNGNPEPSPQSAAAAAAAEAPKPAEGEAPPASSPALSKEERFELSFRVGKGIDVSGIRGSLEDGVLTLVLPKVAPEPPADPIEIPIDFAAGSSNGNHKRNAGGEGRPAASTVRGEEASKEASSATNADTHISLS
ncbi:unnamed protein product [Pylaiella littoralis]